MLIRATQLAVQGHDRSEIEQTLEREFGAADAALVVEQCPRAALVRRGPAQRSATSASRANTAQRWAAL
jgi:hypothetical protein